MSNIFSEYGIILVFLIEAYKKNLVVDFDIPLSSLLPRLECTLAHSAASILQPRSAQSEYEAFQSEVNLEISGNNYKTF